MWNTKLTLVPIVAGVLGEETEGPTPGLLRSARILKSILEGPEETCCYLDSTKNNQKKTGVTKSYVVR